MRIWGYWATLGWAFLAFVASQFLALAILVLLRISDLDSLVNAPFDGKLVTLFIVIANPIMIAIITRAACGLFGLSHAAAARYWHRTCRSRRPDCDRRRASLFRWIPAGYAVSGAVLHHRRRARMAGGALGQRRRCRAGGRGSSVSRLFISRLGAFAALGMAGDCHYLPVMGGAARPIRLDRHSADIRCWTVSRLDTLAQWLDAAHVFSARAVQRRRHAGDS